MKFHNCKAKMPNQTASDLKNERKKCLFNVLELTHILDGGPEKTKYRKEMEHAVLSDPEWNNSRPLGCLSHEEKYTDAIKKAIIIERRMARFKPNIQDFGKTFIKEQNLIGLALLKDGNPFLVHKGMFIPTLVWQATTGQQQKWLNRAWNNEIIGTYAQTELGHGTFIRGLQTTATYDPKSEEFILNTPTITAYKWWPGALGHTANYAVVMAQLYTKGKCHGIHPFLVQLRNENNHMPLPGIDIGEIGPKMGYNTTNNGYLGFKYVRIPRDQMLMKYSQVFPDGTYVPPKNIKLSYGTMLFVRVIMIFEAAFHLKRASLIATRYSAIRRQSQINPKVQEVQVLDFLTQQRKIFPWITASIAFTYLGEWLWDTYVQINNELQKGNLNQLPEIHALACVLKAVTSADASEGTETCRKACGGHGFALSSGFGYIYGLATPMITYEGENTVMYLQTARFLLKAWENPAIITASPTIRYMSEVLDQNRPFEKSVEWIVYILQNTAARAIESTSKHIRERVTNGESLEDAWNKTSLELAEAAEVHGRAFILDNYRRAVKEQKASAELKAVLIRLVELHAVDTLLRMSGLVLKYTKVLDINTEIIQRWYEDLLIAIRPQAVGLVDAFDIPDEFLASALGAYDGDVYKRIFAEAKKSPLNDFPVHKSFDMHLKPFMKSNQLKSNL